MFYKLAKYVLEALAISVSIFLTNKKVKANELLLLTITIMASIILLETFSPSIMTAMKQGMGLGIGLGQVGMLGGGGGSGSGAVNEGFLGAEMDKSFAGVPNDILNSMTMPMNDIKPYEKEN